ncbi:MAG: Uma2 family endonuclease [Archangium sp.]
MHVAETIAAYNLTWRDWASSAPENQVYELIAGEFCVSPSPTIDHQRLVSRISIALSGFIDEARRGEVFIAPLGVRLSEHDVVEPDVFVVLRGDDVRMTEHMVVGAPSLVVEVLSAGTARRDLVDKADLYWRYGVREYWVVDPRAKSLTQLTRGKTKWKSLKAGTLISTALLPGFELALKSLFR